MYLTSRCNLRCSFCNIHKKPSKDVLGLSQAQRLIRDLSGLGCFYLSLTGGEPFLVDHVFDILISARQARIPYLHLVTNGTLLNQENVLRLKDTGLNEISISIDGSEEVHDRLRGVPGTYQKACRGIELLGRLAPGIRVVLNAVFFPHDPSQALNVLSLAKRYNIGLKVQCLNQHPVFSREASGADAGIFSGTADGLKVQETINALKKDRSVVNSRLYLDNLYYFLFRKNDLIFKHEPCVFGYHHLEVREDGMVFPCLEGCGWERGFALENDLKTVLQSQAYLARLKELKTCQGCRRNYYVCYYEPRIAFPVHHFLRSLAAR